jgi:hypothetical protein
MFKKLLAQPFCILCNFVKVNELMFTYICNKILLNKIFISKKVYFILLAIVHLKKNLKDLYNIWIRVNYQYMRVNEHAFSFQFLYPICIWRKVTIISFSNCTKAWEVKNNFHMRSQITHIYNFPRSDIPRDYGP